MQIYHVILGCYTRMLYFFPFPIFSYFSAKVGMGCILGYILGREWLSSAGAIWGIWGGGFMIDDILRCPKKL